MTPKEKAIENAVEAAVAKFERFRDGKQTTSERYWSWVATLLNEKIGRVWLLIAGVWGVSGGLSSSPVLRSIAFCVGFFCLFIYDDRVTAEETHRTFERGQCRYAEEQARRGRQ